MQTFLPYKEFYLSAQCLDMKRLGKQRVEAYQILKSIFDPEYGFRNHPAKKMWENYPLALEVYAKAICIEWVKRGYKDTMFNKINDFMFNLFEHGILKSGNSIIYPPWLGSEDFHLSHKSNLLRKNPDHYKKFWPDIDDNLPYVWP